MKRKKRVRMHLVDQHPGSGLPSIEGLLISKRNHEYVVGLPSLLVAPGANAAELEAHWVAIPRERVAFYEVLS